MLSAALAALTLLAAGTAGAENRLALVIGNNAYTEVEPLDRAVADARLYRKVLEEQRGFRVFYAENAGRREMNDRVAEFLAAITPGDTAMIVYSGHGVQLENERRDSLYLLPVDFPNRDPGRGAENHFFDSESLNFARLAENVAARGAKLRIFVLDACRNNPFNRKDGTRAIGVSRGIGRIQSSSGEFVIYAAAPGEVAFDSLPGDGADSGNSVFTRSFIKYFRTGAYLEDVANDVQAEVVNLARAANVAQEPYYSDGVAGRTCLDDSCGAATSPDEKLATEQEELYWKYCEEKDQAVYCRAFLERYPNSWRAGLAEARLKVLDARVAAASGTDKPGSDKPAGDRLAAVDGTKEPDRTVVRGSDNGGKPAAGKTTDGKTTDGNSATTDDTTPSAKKPDDAAPPLTGNGLAVTGEKPGHEEAKKPDARSTGDDGTGDRKPDAADRDGNGGDGTRLAAVDPRVVTGASAEPITPTRDQLRDVQVRLTVLGHRPGPIDGLMGDRTRQAIEAFQKSEDMDEDGAISKALIARLELRVPDATLESYYARIEADRQARIDRDREIRERNARERAINTRPRRDEPARDRGTVKPPAGSGDTSTRAADNKRPDTATKPDNRTTIPGTRIRTNVQLRDSKTKQKPFYCRASPERAFWDEACQ